MKNPFDPEQNVDAGVRHLKSLLESYNGDVNLTLAAYNAGEGAVRRSAGVPHYRRNAGLRAAHYQYLLRRFGFFTSRREPRSRARSTGCARRALHQQHGLIAQHLLSKRLFEFSQVPRQFNCNGGSRL